MQYTNVTEYLDRRACSVGVLFSFNQFTGKLTRHLIYCKKRSCPNCEDFWRRRHLNRLQEREANLLFHGKQHSEYHLVLTTSYKVEKEKVYDSFRYFFQLLRAKFDAKIEYFCSVEQNRKATQQHFHFLLSFVGKEVTFLDYRLVRKLWQKAQQQAHFAKIAHQTFCKLLKGNNIGFYMLKYITKSGEKKYEVPTKEVWAGRTVRASRGFYPVSVAVIDMAFYARKTFENPELANQVHFELFPNVDGACGSRYDVLEKFVRANQVAKATWDIHGDYCSGIGGLANRKPFKDSIFLSRTLKVALDNFQF